MGIYVKSQGGEILVIRHGWLGRQGSRPEEDRRVGRMGVVCKKPQLYSWENYLIWLPESIQILPVARCLPARQDAAPKPAPPLLI